MDALIGPDGWITWEALLARIDRKTVSDWVAAGRLLRVQPGVYTVPSAALDRRVRLEAIAGATGGLISHRSALALWELVPWVDGPVHVTVDFARSGRGSAGVLLHRSRDLTDVARRVDGLPVTSVERAVVDAWGVPGGAGRDELRAAAISGVRRRLCGPRDILREVGRRPCLPGRAELSSLVGLLSDGCQSELEIWGCLQVLRAPAMPPFVQQRRVTVAGEVFVLDAAYDDVLLAVEMDGAAWHGSREQRERDIRRDALLATIGWQTLRFGWTRMRSAPDACRRDILAAYLARQRLMTPERVR